MTNRGGITKSESITLSIIRVIAMFLIISCHVAQSFDWWIAWLLNVGVQVFFFMSGFLYGKKDSPISPLAFYKKRFQKIYIPYVIWLVIIVAVYSLFHLSPINAKQIILYLLNLQWFSIPIDGLNHLWFLTVLMFGYLMTPWIKRLHAKYPILFFSVFIVFCITEFVFVKKFYSIFAWVVLYIAGMMFGHYYSKKISNIVIVVSVAILIVFGVPFRKEWLTQIEYRYHAIWLHWVLGVFLFALLFRILPLVVNSDKRYAAVMHVDAISYEVYLTHHALILGPLAMMSVTNYSWANVLLMLTTVYVLSKILHNISSFSNNLL